MLVDPNTRQAVANEADAAGMLKPVGGGTFAGKLPPDLALANTALGFGGKRWAMVLLPLPREPEALAVLLAHEAFHRVQPQLNLSSDATEGRNGHLDREGGRNWLQLELRALDRALADLAAGRNPRAAARDALAFRAERRRLFTQAAADEATLERVEGTAEYTGIMAAGSDTAGRAVLARRNLEQLPKRPSFTRAFAYATGPAYGLLLNRLAGDGWRKRLVAGATFDQLLSGAVGGSGSVTPQARSTVYGGAALAASERTRESARLKGERELRASLVDGPVLVVPIAGSISFDPGKVTTLEGAGTVYNGLKTAGPWGALEATGAALVAPDWSSVRVAGPVVINGNTVTGPTWRVELAAGWRVSAGQLPRQQTISKAPATP